ncbi:MAG: hypothetical protein KKH83_01810 [Candidatus Margulisbacteria bacterium]|nr:hypothetical protein [Candidatus Margulisiibacteriota bacterium]
MNSIIKISIEDRIFAGISYLFIPALYALISEKRKVRLVSHHAAHALFFWSTIFGLWVLMRWLVFEKGVYLDLFMPLFCLCGIGLIICSIMAVLSKFLRIPVISDILNVLI